MTDLLKITIKSGRAHFDLFASEFNKGIKKHNKLMTIIRNFLSLYGITSGTFKFENFNFNKESARHWITAIDPNIPKKELKETKDLISKIYLLNFKKLAASGNPEGDYKLATCYLNGYGIEKNLLKAFELYQKAADSGYTKALVKMGELFLGGIGVQADPVKAFDYFMQAAQKGDVEAQKKVGACYQTGIGCSPDAAEYIDWFKKAAAQKDVIAFEVLSLEYLQGTVVEKDEELAHDYMYKAAEYGSNPAKFYLGRFNLNGIGIKRDVKTAISWLQKAAKDGNQAALEDLGYFYLHGVNVNKNFLVGGKHQYVANKKGSPVLFFNQGIQYLLVLHDATKAQESFAKAGITEKHFNEYKRRVILNYSTPFDKFNLGVYYALGLGTTKDLEKAKPLLEEALKEKHPHAKAALDTFFK